MVKLFGKSKTPEINKKYIENRFDLPDLYCPKCGYKFKVEIVVKNRVYDKCSGVSFVTKDVYYRPDIGCEDRYVIGLHIGHFDVVGGKVKEFVVNPSFEADFESFVEGS